MTESFLKELRGLDVHDRLLLLAGDASKASCDPVEIQIDAVSYFKLLDSERANQSGSITYDRGYHFWRGIKCEVLALVPDSSFDQSVLETGELTAGVVLPFCLALVARKPSGRYAYFDDPETDEVYR